MNYPRVLLVGNFLSSRPGARGIGEELASQLSQRGWRVLETSHQTSRVLRPADMVSFAIIHRGEYDVANVDVYSGLAFIWAELLVRVFSILKKPAALTLRGGGLLEFAESHPSRCRNLFKRVRVVSTPSRFLQTGLARYSPAIRYLPAAIDVGRYPFRLRSHPGPAVMWLRAFHKIYQPDLAVKALAVLMRDYGEATLTMVGPDKRDGSLAAALAAARQLGILSHVNVQGPARKSDVPAALAEGDVFLNTTRYESFGVSVLEAALSGLPIVTTKVGELPYLWDDRKTAMLVPKNEPGAIADAIRQVLAEPGLAEELSWNARKKAETFDWRVVLPQWELLFTELLDA